MLRLPHLADGAAEAFLVVGASPAQHLLCVEYSEGEDIQLVWSGLNLLPPTPGAALPLVLRQDGGGVHQAARTRHYINTLHSRPTEEGGGTLTEPITLDTVNLLVAS